MIRFGDDFIINADQTGLNQFFYFLTGADPQISQILIQSHTYILQFSVSCLNFVFQLMTVSFGKSQRITVNTDQYPTLTG